ncbi:unnamed protein product [Orchesella dallaii]|uniref:IST1 homolog n=1 Tax=Orchesella dallaii TaxID=48710 RepID=A0ABP1QG58_9HEXA
MFSSGPNYQKLKTNLRLSLNRLKLLEKKKTELGLKARKEIADYIQDGKVERAKIRVEHIIREDYIVEAMEIVEMYCDLLLARFGLIEQMKELDEGLAEAVSSLIWVAPRLQTDVNELKLIGDQLITKYGKPYGLACRENAVGTVSPKLMQKLSVQAPPKILVEKYLIEISKIYNVLYEPDHRVFHEADELLIDVSADDQNTNNLGGGGGASGGGAGPSGGGGGGGSTAPPMQEPGFIGYPYMPMPANPAGNPPAYTPFSYPEVPPIDKAQYQNSFPDSPLNIPPKHDLSGFGMPMPPPHGLPSDKELNVNFTNNVDPRPKPAPRAKLNPSNDGSLDLPDLPELPSVPFTDPSDSRGNVGGPNINSKSNDENDIDFDDLTRRFEELKKRK